MILASVSYVCSCSSYQSSAVYGRVSGDCVTVLLLFYAALLVMALSFVEWYVIELLVECPFGNVQIDHGNSWNLKLEIS